MITLRLGSGVALLAVAAAGCVSPSRTNDDYRHKVANSAEAMASVVATAQLAASVGARGRGWSAYVEQTLNDALNDASGIQTSFDVVQSPTPAADELGQRLDAVLTDATDGIDQLLTDARRGQLDDLPRDAAPLQDVADRLDALQQVA